MQDGVWDRCDLVISTKLMWGGRGGRDTMNSIGLTRKHLVEGIHSSLARMQLDHVDLCVLPPYPPSTHHQVPPAEQEFHLHASRRVFCHRPDPITPIWETVRAMNFIIDQGLAYYWGTSMWTANQLAEARDVANRLGAPLLLVHAFFAAWG